MMLLKKSMVFVFNVYKNTFVRTPLTLICNNFMRFVLQNPIVRSQSFEKIEPKFKAAYDGS
jgi:hypothetical protein